MSKPVSELLSEVAQTMSDFSSATSDAYGKAAVRADALTKAVKPVLDAELCVVVDTIHVNQAVVDAEILAANAKFLGSVDAEVVKAEANRLAARVAAADKSVVAAEEARKAREAARQATKERASAALQTLSTLGGDKDTEKKG